MFDCLLDRIGDDVRQGDPFAERRHAAIPCQRRVFWCPPAKAEASTYGQYFCRMRYHAINIHTY